jgi:hypothetical protein
MTEPDLGYIHPSLRGLAVPVGGLTHDPKNARVHGEKNMAAIKASLSRFGMRSALVAQRQGDRLVVRAGNGRLQAAKELGWAYVPVIVFEEGDVEAVAYAIADNRAAELAEWDWDLLREGLSEVGGSLRIGWHDEELSSLLGLSKHADPKADPGGQDVRPEHDVLLSENRMVSLFFQPEEFEKFSSAVELLSKISGLSTTSEIVLFALQERAREARGLAD